MQSTLVLTELIRKKHQVLVQLREIGRRQTDLVTSGETSALLKLLATKQKLITGLQELEGKLRPFYAEHPDSRVWSSPAERATCAQMANECNTLLEQIVSLEKLGAEKMAARKREVAEQLQQAHAAAHVRSAYQAQQRSHA
jgi:hypothetical protein